MLVKFFLTCNKIGAFTLGGGYAMIPIMEQEFVDKNQWMNKQEFMDIMVVAQTTPGIFAIDMASHIGYKLKGVWGGIVGAIGIALPSIIAILIIAMFFQHFKDNYWVGKFFMGVRPAVIALIAAPCFKMAKTANPENQENREQKLPSLRVYLMLLHNILNQNMVNMYAQLMEVYSIKYMMKLDKSHPKLK